MCLVTANPGMSKVWANGLVITVAVGLSLTIVVRMILAIPIAGSIPLFMAGVVIYLFFATPSRTSRSPNYTQPPTMVVPV